VVIGCCAFLVAPAAASAAKTWSEGGVSARYQTVSCDTATSVELAGRRVAPDSLALRAHTGIPASYLRFPSQERRLSVSGYQLPQAISINQRVVSFRFSNESVRSTSETCADNGSWTSSTISGKLPRGQARILLQLAVAFAAAYVLFLGIWFWGTRDRRSRVGGAVRS
jgi:hypothetical protein